MTDGGDHVPKLDYITADALGPMLDKITQDIQTGIKRQTEDITRQIVQMMDTKIESAIKEVRDDVKTLDDRSGRHSERLKEVALQIAASSDREGRLMATMDQLGVEIKNLTKSVETMVNAQTDLRRMIEFHSTEIDQTRMMTDRANTRLDEHLEQSIKIRNTMNENIRAMTSATLELSQMVTATRAETAGIKVTLAEQREMVASLNTLFLFFQTRGKKIAAVVATVGIAQGDNIVNFISQLIGGIS